MLVKLPSRNQVANSIACARNHGVPGVPTKGVDAVLCGSTISRAVLWPWDFCEMCFMLFFFFFLILTTRVLETKPFTYLDSSLHIYTTTS